MHLSHRRILEAIRAAAGDVPEGRDLVRYIEEHTVYIAPQPGHPVLDELESPAGRRFSRELRRAGLMRKSPSLSEVPAIRGLYHELVQQAEDGGLTLAQARQTSTLRLLAVILNPLKGLFDGHKPNHFPTPKGLDPDALCLLPMPTHREFVRRDRESSLPAANGAKLLWSAKGPVRVRSISITPARSHKTWLGLSILLAAYTERALTDLVHQCYADADRIPETARQVVSEVFEQEGERVIQRSGVLFERMLRASQLAFFGRVLNSTDRPMFDAEAMQAMLDSRGIRRALGNRRMPERQLIAFGVHGIAERWLPAQSKFESAARLSLLRMTAHHLDAVEQEPSVICN